MSSDCETYDIKLYIMLYIILHIMKKKII